MEKNQTMEEMFRKYCDEVANLMKGAKPFAGMFGFGSGPKDNPCHERFIADLNREAERMAAEPVSPEEAKKTVSFLLSLQQTCERDNLVYWTCMAAHGAAVHLIPLLLPEDAEALCKQYNAMLPRRMRMPLQEKVMKMLSARGREA